MPVTIYKEITEIILPARMMYAIAIGNVFVVEDEVNGREELGKLRRLLKYACLQPLESLPYKLQEVAAKSIDRLHNSVMAEYDNHRADKVAASIYYFLKEITDSGYLELWEGSPVAEAAEMYLPMIEHVFGEEKIDQSAQKQSRRILAHLQKRGYYV